MAGTNVPKDRTIDALEEEYAALVALLGELRDDEWAQPSPCPGWDVRANVAHVIGTESALAGRPQPNVELDRDALTHVRNDIGWSNETWIASMAAAPPAELRARLAAITAERIAALRAMDQGAWDAEVRTPAGPDTYGRFMRIRVFDCWMHEQDIRDATERPGHESGRPVEVVLDEMVAALGYVVGKRAGAPAGSAITFELAGDSGRTVHVDVQERAALVEQLDRPATVTLRMPVGVFTRLGGGRTSATPEVVELAGDEALGRQIVANLAYTI